MLELERKYWKEYKAEKRIMREYKQAIKINKIKFFNVFHYLINEYYKNLKKEFLDSEIIEKCHVTADIVNEVKSFLENKKIAQITKNKLHIHFETILFLEELTLQNKKRTINFWGIAIFVISIIIMILIIASSFILENLKGIIIFIFSIVIICTIGNILYNILNKSK